MIEPDLRLCAVMPAPSKTVYQALFIGDGRVRGKSGRGAGGGLAGVVLLRLVAWFRVRCDDFPGGRRS